MRVFQDKIKAYDENLNEQPNFDEWGLKKGSIGVQIIVQKESSFKLSNLVYKIKWAIEQ